MKHTSTRNSQTLKQQLLQPVKSTIKAAAGVARGIERKAEKAIIGTERALERAVGLNQMQSHSHQHVTRSTARRLRRRRRGALSDSTANPSGGTTIKSPPGGELIGQLSSTTGFGAITHGLTPTNASLFPILATEALNWEFYRFKRLKFHLKSMMSAVSSNTSMGTHGLGVTYDPDEPVLSDYRSCANYDGGRSFKMERIDRDVTITPRLNAQLNRLHYVQNDPAASAQALGFVYFITNGNPSAGVVISEIRMHYEIEFSVRRPNSVTGMMQDFMMVATPSGGAQAMFPPTNMAGYGMSTFGPQLASIGGTAPTQDRLQFNSPGYYRVIYKVEAVNPSLATMNVSIFGQAPAVVGCALVTPTAIAASVVTAQYNVITGQGTTTSSVVMMDYIAFDAFVNVTSTIGSGSALPYIALPGLATGASSTTVYTKCTVMRFNGMPGMSQPSTSILSTTRTEDRVAALEGQIRRLLSSRNQNIDDRTVVPAVPTCIDEDHSSSSSSSSSTCGRTDDEYTMLESYFDCLISDCNKGTFSDDLMKRVGNALDDITIYISKHPSLSTNLRSQRASLLKYYETARSVRRDNTRPP